MEVKITAQLPFSWCQFCNRKDLKTETLIADGAFSQIVELS